MIEPSNVYEGLRQRFLAIEPPADATPGDSVYAVLIEVGMEKLTTSIAATSAGDASLYLSTGGGILGGQGIADARESAKRLVIVAAGLLEQAEAVEATNGPAPGEMVVFLLTRDGLRSTRQPVSGKFMPDDPLIALVHEQGVLLKALQAGRTKGIAAAP